MRSKFALIVLIGASMIGPAMAANVNGTLQEEFVCPQGNCNAMCVGPGGPATIGTYKDLKAWMIGQPDRLWLQKTDSQNNVSITVLGVGDRCTFQGISLPISGPIEVSPTPQPGPTCTCIGNVCNPPGCGPH
jgi:hypothetical protein